MLEDPRALPIFLITFYSIILISSSFFKVNISYRKIAIFSIILSFFDYLTKYLAIKLGYLLIWHIVLSLVLLILLIYKISQINFFTSLAVSLTGYILMFLSETLTIYPCLFILKHITKLDEKIILSNQFWYSILAFLIHLPLYLMALLYVFYKQLKKDD